MAAASLDAASFLVSVMRKKKAAPAGFEPATHGPGNLPRYLQIEQIAYFYKVF
jgi:hypothetical protein